MKDYNLLLVSSERISTKCGASVSDPQISIEPRAHSCWFTRHTRAMACAPYTWSLFIRGFTKFGTKIEVVLTLPYWLSQLN